MRIFSCVVRECDSIAAMLQVRFGFVATVLGLAGSFVVARIIDAGHGTRHALSLDDVPDLFAKVSQLGSRVSGTTRMGLTMLAMYVIRKLMNK